MQDTTNELRRDVTTLSGMTTERMEGLQKLSIETVADLIKHLPLRFDAHHGGVTIEEAITILGDELWQLKVAYSLCILPMNIFLQQQFQP